jgi:Tfp pilus assembly PilM family ATPase
MVSLDIGQTAVRGVRITRSLFGARATERFEQKVDRVAASDPFDVPTDAQIQAIRALMVQGKILPGEPVSCCLPGPLVSTHLLTLPFRDPEKLRQAIPFEMEERLPFELDEVVIDFHPAAGHGASDFFVFTAQKTVLQKYVAAFDRIGLSCARIGVDLLAFDEAFRRASQPPEGDLFLIDFGASKTLVCFLRDGKLRAVRAIPIGGDALTLALTATQTSGGTVPWQEREEIKQAIDLGDIGEDRAATAGQKALMLKLHEWMREIEKGMVQTPAAAQRLFCLVGGGAKMKGLVGLLASEWGIPAIDAPAGFQATSACDRNETSRFRPRLHEVNFLRPEVEARPVSSSGVWIAAGALIVVIGLAAADFSLRYRQKEERYRSFKAEMQRRFSTLFPEAKNMAGREIDFLRSALSRLGKMENDLAMGRAGAYATFKALTLALPEMASMEVHTVDVDDRTIRMEMQTDSFPLVDQVRAHLLKEPRFSEVTVSDAKVSADTSKVRFRVQITLTPQPAGRR